MQMSRLRAFAGLNTINAVFKHESRAAVKLITANFHQDTTTADNVAATRPLEEIPGPSSLPLIGPLLHFLPGGSIGTRVGIELSEVLYKTYGPIVRIDGMLGKPTFIFLYDADACAQVLRGESTYPVRPGFQSLEYYRKEYVKPKQELTGLITDHGEPWKAMRSAVNPVMLKPKTVQLYAHVLDEVAQDMIARMKSLRDENNKIPGDFDVELNKWALESIGTVALGGRIGCLDPNLPADSPARELIQNIHEIFQLVQDLDFKPSLWRYYSTKNFKKAMYLFDRQMELSKIYIKRAVKDIEKAKGTVSANEKGILEKLLEVDENMAVIMASDMLFAGVDTAANTVLATMYLLAVNPDKQQKLREEVLQQDEKQRYLKACIKESMRMLPVVSGNLRRTTREYNLMGYHIPNNTNIIFNHQYLSLMEDQFPRPAEFIPERWLTTADDPLHHGRASPFANMPFGFGARQCIGKRIAALEMETFVSRLVQNFEIGWEGGDLNVVSNSLNYVKGPFDYTFKDI